MGIKRNVVTMLFAAVLTVLVGAGVVSAAGRFDPDEMPQNTTIAASEVHDGALYAAGQTLTIDGTVNGDVYCGMQTVTVAGTVEGDLICGAQTVSITGEVKGDVRVGAQTVDINGVVGGSVSAFAQSVSFGKESTVAGDVNGAAASATLAGAVARDVLLGVENLAVSGTVGRHIGGEYDTLAVAEGAQVGGYLRYTSDKEATVADGTVKGEVVRTAPTRDGDEWNDGRFATAAGFYFFVSMLLISLVIALVAPRLIHAVSGQGVNRLLPSLLVGFFVVFGGPFLLFLLAITVVGIPLAGLLGLVWVLMLLLSGPVFGYYLGRVIMQRRTANPLLIMLVGSVVLILAYFVPIANIFALFAAAVIGSGMIVLAIASKYKKPVYKVESKTV